jgi:hypothetical protein
MFLFQQKKTRKLFILLKSIFYEDYYQQLYINK